VLFITDGDPTATIRGMTPEEYQTVVPLSNAQVNTGQNSNVALGPAVSNANAVKAQDSHILAVGVGEALDNAASLARLEDIAGPDVFPDGGSDFDISTTDVFREADFSLLKDALREAAFQLCAPSVNIRKQVDLDPDPDVDVLVPGAGWQLSAEVTPVPASWVIPDPDAPGSATGETGHDGFVNFQWTTAAPQASSITVAEEVQPGFLNDTAATACTYITPEQQSPLALPDLAVTAGGFTGTVPSDAIVTCDMVNRVVSVPGIDLEKATNGHDADEPPGPSIPVGETVTWTYRVTNVGNVPLTGLTVVDNRLGEIECPQTTLAVQATVTCTATGAAVAGPYDNEATASAEGAGTTVTDSDLSHHTGSLPGLDIVKLVNGEDANDAPGVFIPVGDPVTWTYLVTNTGDATVDDIEVTDDQGVEVTCPATTLAPAENMTCTAPPAVAEAGPYSNHGIVTGTSATAPGVTLEDSDPAHHFGEAPDITLVKSVNGDDANTAPGVAVTVGDPVHWELVVTNTGNVPLLWSIDDPALPLLICHRPVLAPGASATCVAQAPAEEGQHTNTATVTGTSPSGNAVTDEDPANYYGVVGGISVVKRVNGDDANQPPGPVLPVGSEVTWTYEVTNEGNSELTNVEVVDTKGVSITCPATTLAPAEAMTCTATGTATADAHTNFARATGETPLGMIVQDEDPANFFGGEPGIHVEKLIHGVAQLDEPPGVLVPVGEPVEWTFVVTNTGNLPLTDVRVVDDRLGPIDCPATTLATGASMTCAATAPAEPGQHENVVTATGTDPLGTTETDEDPSHYFGVVRAIELTKLVNGEDANEAPGLEIPSGDPVVMTFEVTNPGNLTLLDVELVDDRGLTPAFTGGDTDGDGALDPGEVWTYEADLGPATPGRFDNLATVTAHDGLETGVSDSDPAFAGSTPRAGITIDKSAVRSQVRVGEVAEFVITVTNTGDAALTGVVVTDDVVPACGRSIGDLAPGATVEYRCSVRIDETIVNLATVTGTQLSGATVSDGDTARVEVLAGGTLPQTGGDPTGMVQTGLALVAMGVVLLLVARPHPER